MKRVNAARDELTSQAFGWMIAVPFSADGALNIARQLYATPSATHPMAASGVLVKVGRILRGHWHPLLPHWRGPGRW